MGTGQILRSAYQKRINEYVDAIRKHFPKDAYEDMPIINILKDSEKYYYEGQLYERDFMRHLVDTVWSEAKENDEVLCKRSSGNLIDDAIDSFRK